jgi:diguanylate cyclase (GGDEF)-like protein
MTKLDARVREMQFLAQLEREGEITIKGPYDRSFERKMIVSLVDREYVNGIDSLYANGIPVGSGGEGGVVQSPEQVVERYRYDRIRCIGLLLGDKVFGTYTGEVTVRISHMGRVRLSELRQQLKTGRDRDPTGLCLAKRHLLTDLAVALTAADKDAPLTVVFLDMNGLKAINDTHGHRAGDEAIRAYLEAVVATFGEHGEAYRGEGGDEAVVVLPDATDKRAGKLLDAFVRQIGKEVLVLGEARAEVRLTASCGSATTTDPNEEAAALEERADKVQYRAKAVARQHTPRVSTIAVGDGEVTAYSSGGMSEGAVRARGREGER